MLALLPGFSGPYYSILWYRNDAIGYFRYLAWPLLAGLALNSCVRAFAGFADRRRAQLDHAEVVRPARARWCVLPICALLLVSASVSDWPLQLRFRLSRPALETAAHAHLAKAAGNRKPGWVGLYYFDHVLEDEAGVGFMKSGGFWQCAGFFYSPSDTLPSGADILRSERIAPNWFIFDWHF